MLPADDAARKAIPLCTGVYDYFPAALAAIAEHSKRGNDKHNPGKPLHWSRDKSTDHEDCIARHLLERDYVALAWRALAALQIDLERRGAPVAVTPRPVFTPVQPRKRKRK